MNKFTHFIIILFFGLSLQGGFYIFLFPVFKFAGFIALGIAIISFFFLFKSKFFSEKNIKPPHSVFLSIAILLIALEAALLARPYGDWDAWLMWNFYARCLTSANHWTAIYIPTAFGNQSHPLLLPSVVASWWSILFSGYKVYVPFVLGLLPTIAIPTLIISERGRFYTVKQLALILLSFILCKFYINIGIDQFADIWISFFYLIIYILLHYTITNKLQHLYFFIAWFMAAAAFTKNEALVFDIFLVLVFYKNFFSKAFIKYGLLGLLPFGFAIIYYKIKWAAPSPVISSWLATDVYRLFSIEKLSIIIKYIIIHSFTSFLPITILLIYFLIKISTKKIPWNRFSTHIRLIALAYACVYSGLSFNGTEWNVATSLPRLGVHLAPSMIWIALQRLSTISETNLVISVDGNFEKQ